MPDTNGLGLVDDIGILPSPNFKGTGVQKPTGNLGLTDDAGVLISSPIPKQPTSTVPDRGVVSHALQGIGTATKYLGRMTAMPSIEKVGQESENYWKNTPALRMVPTLNKAGAALDIGGANLAEGISKSVDYLTDKTGLTNPEDPSTIASRKNRLINRFADYYRKRGENLNAMAEKSNPTEGESFAGELIGGALPGIAEYTLGTIPAALKGAAEAKEQGKSEIAGAVRAGAERFLLGKLFEGFRIGKPAISKEAFISKAKQSGTQLSDDELAHVWEEGSKTFQGVGNLPWKKRLPANASAFVAQTVLDNILTGKETTPADIAKSIGTGIAFGIHNDRSPIDLKNYMQPSTTSTTAGTTEGLKSATERQSADEVARAVGDRLAGRTAVPGEGFGYSKRANAERAFANEVGQNIPPIAPPAPTSGEDIAQALDNHLGISLIDGSVIGHGRRLLPNPLAVPAGEPYGGTGIDLNRDARRMLPGQSVAGQQEVLNAAPERPMRDVTRTATPTHPITARSEALIAQAKDQYKSDKFLESPITEDVKVPPVEGVVKEIPTDAAPLPDEYKANAVQARTIRKWLADGDQKAVEHIKDGLEKGKITAEEAKQLLNDGQSLAVRQGKPIALVIDDALKAIEEFEKKPSEAKVGTKEAEVPRGAKLEGQSAKNEDIHVGDRVKTSDSPQAYSVIGPATEGGKVIKPTAAERENGEYYVRIKNEKTGDEQNILASDLSHVGAKKAAKAVEAKKPEQIPVRTIRSIVESGDKEITLNEIRKGVSEVKTGQYTASKARELLEKQGVKVVPKKTEVKSAKPGEQPVHDYSSTQVNLPKSEAKPILDFGKSIPDSEIYTDPNDPTVGREDKPHITVKYGIHTENPKEIAPLLEGSGPVTAKLGKIDVLTPKDKPYDVVVVEVESKQLHDLNAKVADGTKVTDTYPEYTPHVTVAYVKKGEGAKYKGDTRFEGKEITFDSVSFTGKDEEATNINLKGEKTQGKAGETSAEKVRSDEERIQEGRTVGQGGEGEGGQNLQLPAQAGAEAGNEGKQIAKPGGKTEQKQGTAQTKEPWEMTKEEFKRHQIVTEGHQAMPRDIVEQRAQEETHKQYIQQAISAGKPVPNAVLKEYGIEKPAVLPQKESAGTVTPSPEKAGAAKEPWEMTKSDVKALGDRIQKIYDEVEKENPRDRADRTTQLKLEEGKLRKLQATFDSQQMPSQDLRDRIKAQTEKVDAIRKSKGDKNKAIDDNTRESANRILQEFPDLFDKIDEYPYAIGNKKYSAIMGHKSSVERSAKEGKIGEGIKSYPDLMEKYGQKESHVPTEVQGVRGAPEKAKAEEPARPVKLTDEQIKNVAVRQQDTPEEVVKDAVKAAPETTAKELKVQKKFLVEHIDEAIKDAPTMTDKTQGLITKLQRMDNTLEKLRTSIAVMRKGSPEVEKSDAEYKRTQKEYDETQKMIPSVTIEVPNDGNFTVYNDKETLKKFKEIVSKKFPTTPEKETRVPKLPAGSARGYRAPAKLKDAIALNLNGKPAYTDGHIILFGESKAVPSEPTNKEALNKERIEKTGAKQILDENKKSSILPVDKIKFFALEEDYGYGISDNPIKGDKSSTTVLMSGDKSAAINTDYYQHIIEQYPDATFKIGDTLSKGDNIASIGVYDKGKHVGVVMPWRAPEAVRVAREHLDEPSAEGKAKSVATPVQEELATPPAAEPKGKKGAEEGTPITDFGEKIGGARKDTAERGYEVGTKSKTEEAVPVWKKRFKTAEKTDGSGRFTIIDTKEGRFSFSGEKQTFATEAEAEAAIPLYAVAKTHHIYENSDKTWSIYKRIGDRKRFKVVQQDFASREDAMKYMAVNAEKILNTKTTFGEEILPVPEIAIRKGVERRTGPATPEMFMESFAPRGIEFGNWNNQEERQQVMNHAYDGLLDLAEVLNVPPKALMLNGDLAIAFGARGQGLTGAKAHYEPDYGVINLTKMKGAGSLAHEWLHAADHYLGRLDTKASSEKITNKRGDMVYKTKGTADMLSQGISYKSQVRPEVQAAYKSLIETMYKKAEQFVEDTKQADKFVGTAREHLKGELDGIRQNLARDLAKEYTWRKVKKGLSPASTEQLAEFDRLANILTEGGDLETKFRYDNPNTPATSRAMASGRRTNDTLEGLSRIMKAVRNRNGFNKENDGVLDKVRVAMNVYSARLKMLSDAKSGAEKTKQVPTSFAMEAKKMDQARTGDYWSEPHEMAARAFAAYVEDKVAEKGGQSDFLVYHAHGGILVPMIDGFIARPYPEGKERVATNEAFDKFIGTLKTKETEKGVALYAAHDTDTALKAIDDQFSGKNIRPATVMNYLQNLAKSASISADEASRMTAVIREQLDRGRQVMPKSELLDLLGKAENVQPNETLGKGAEAARKGPARAAGAEGNDVGASRVQRATGQDVLSNTSDYRNAESEAFRLVEQDLGRSITPSRAVSPLHRKIADTIEKVNGTRIFFAADDNLPFYGVNPKKGYIIVSDSLDTPRFLGSIIGHETFHNIERTAEFSPELATQLQQFNNVARAAIGEDAITDYRERLNRSRRTGGIRLLENNNDVWREYGANIFGDNMTDRRFHERMFQQNRNLYEKFMDLVVNMLKKLGVISKDAVNSRWYTPDQATKLINESADLFSKYLGVKDEFNPTVGEGKSGLEYKTKENKEEFDPNKPPKRNDNEISDIAKDAVDKVKHAIMPGLDVGKGISQGIKTLVAPTSKSPEHLKAAEDLGKSLGAMHRRQEITAEKIDGRPGKLGHREDSLSGLFDKLGVFNKNIPLDQNLGMKFGSDMSQGRFDTMTNPEINERYGTKGVQANFIRKAAQTAEAEFQSRLAELEKAGAPMEKVRENYFPGMWTPESIKAFNQAMGEYLEANPGEPKPLAEWSKAEKDAIKNRTSELLKDGKGSDKDALSYLTKRPLKGKESFRKQKSFDDIMTAVEFGLQPVSTNPMDLVKLKLAEMDRNIMANDYINNTAKPQGDIKFLGIGKEMPEGYTKINDKYGTVYGPPTMKTEEYVDRNVWEGLMNVAGSLGVKHERMYNAGRGKLGWATREPSGQMATQFATELSVLAHEIGHKLDNRYDLWNKIVDGAEGIGKKGVPTKAASAEKRGKIKTELRALADLSWEGTEPSEGYKRQVRKKPEQMAHLLEAYIHAKDRFKEVAPTVFSDFDKFVRSTPEISELADIKQGLSLKKLEGEKSVGGFPIIGYNIAKKPTAEILNNYLSSSLYNNLYFGHAFKAYMGTANSLNQSQLGVFSAFHAGFTTGEVTVSANANVLKDIYGVARGNRTVSDLGKSLAYVPMAAIKTPMEGGEILKEWRNPTMEVPTNVPVKDLSNRIALVAKAAELGGGGFRLEQGLRTENTDKMMQDWYGGNKAKAALRSPLSLVELSAKPIMEWLVPRQKAGVFGHLVGRIVEQNPGKTMDELVPQFRQAQNRVDARLGQVRYDRLFMNNMTKNVIQGMVRAPGWSGGTIAEIGGSLKDTAKFVSDWVKTGKAPQELPDRVSYTLSLMITAAAINGALTYALTGDQPKDMDWWAFRTGNKDEQGRDVRFLLPTYQKDIFAYWQNPEKTLLAKTHPLLSMLSDLLVKNADYYGVEIRHKGDNPLEQAGEVAQYAIQQYVPFWMRGIGKEVEDKGRAVTPSGILKTVAEQPGKTLATEFGIMPASADYLNTPAQKEMHDLMSAHRVMGEQTQEAYDKRKLKNRLKMKFRAGDDAALDEANAAYQDGKLSAKDLKEIRQARSTTAFQDSFKKLQFEDALRVYELANDEERQAVKPILAKKVRNLRNQPADERERLMAKYQEVTET